MDKIQIIILAAGAGKRMSRKDLPKVLIPFKGKPLINHLLKSVKDSGVCDKPAIVVGQRAQMVKRALSGGIYTYIHQEKQLGTGHAVMVAKNDFRGKVEHVMVLYGDHPLISVETIRNLAETHIASGKVMTIATVEVDDFKDWRQAFFDFGRVIRNKDGKVIQIVEKKDATKKQLEIKEGNPSYFCFQAAWLWQNLDQLKTDNAQGEYYLTDLVNIAIKQGKEIATVEIEPKEALGVNTEAQLNSIAKLI